MTTLALSKYQALGNDFLVLLDTQVDDGDLPDLARRLCDRRRGVGADGLLSLRGDPSGISRMVLHNADGSRAEISGNGVRCFAHALARRDGTSGEVTIRTDAGDRRVVVEIGPRPDTVDAEVDMGPVSTIEPPSGWARLEVDPLRPVAHLGLGNPHTVVAVDDVRAVDLAALGALIPDINLEVVEAGHDDGAITMRVNERGVGVTEACGSGACASAWAARRWGLVDRDRVVVHMPGGDATVLLDVPTSGHVSLRGPSSYIGEVVVPR